MSNLQGNFSVIALQPYEEKYISFSQNRKMAVDNFNMFGFVCGILELGI